MIKNVISSSPHIQVSGGNSSWIGNNGPGAGMMRYNTSTQMIEVFDGTSWMPQSMTVYLSMTHEAEEALNWANIKRREEAELEELLKQYPSLKNAHDQFQVVKALVQNAKKSTQS